MPGQAERLPQLEQQVAQLSSELEGINDTWKTRVQGMQETLDSRKSLIDELQTARSALDIELSRANSELRELQAQLGEENQQVLMRYMGLRRRHRRWRTACWIDSADHAAGKTQAQ